MKNILGIIFSVTLLAFGLGGCTTASITSSMMSGVADAVRADNALVFDLSAPAKFLVRRKSKDIILTIPKPTALKSLERSSIVVKTSKNQVALLPGVKWSDRLPRLLQSRLVETFEKVRAVGAVSTGRDQISSNFGLLVNIRSFQINADGSSGNAVVALYVKLIHKGSGRVVSQRLFRSSNHVNIKDSSEGAAGLNRSFQSVARKIVRWVVRAKTDRDYVSYKPSQ